VEDRLAALSDDLDALFAESRERARREYAEQLNQAVRRLRIAVDEEELCGTLENAAAQFAEGALLFRVDDDMARHARIEIALGCAAAFAGAVQSKEPQTAVTAANEVSAALMDLLGHSSGDRASLFPVEAGDRVAALVYAWGTVQGAALELLAQVSGALWSALLSGGREAAQPEREPESAVEEAREHAPLIELVNIARAPMAQAVAGLETAREPEAAPEPEAFEPSPAAAPEKKKPAPAWETLSSEDQQIHLRAQRFARVQVAEMRLYEADAVQSGRVRGDLYDALRKPIDAARESFREQFFSRCESMVDYLHLELMRTLAHDDPDLFGKDYPGPLV